MSYLLSARNPFRPVLVFGLFLGTILVTAGLMLVLAPTANATEPPTTYRVGDWTCATVDGTDQCVYDPNPEDDPVAVEPDNNPVPRSTLFNPAADLDPSRVTVTLPVEDRAGWDCRTSGNGVCGPGNGAGFTAGCYNRNTGALIRPWDEAMAADQHYRPDGCGKRTARDRAMDERLNGRVGQLCAGTTQGGRVCWYADQARPREAHGPARLL